MAKTIDLDQLVVDKKGRTGKVVPIPYDYSHGSKDDPYAMARLVYVLWDGEEDAVLIPESRLSV